MSQGCLWKQTVQEGAQVELFLDFNVAVGGIEVGSEREVLRSKSLLYNTEYPVGHLEQLRSWKVAEGILLGRCLKLVVPVSVELLVLFNVSIFTVLALLLMHKEHLFHRAEVLLLFELSDTVFSQFCLHVTPVTLAQLAMLLHCLTMKE